MKVKINRRLLQTGILCLVVAALLMGYVLRQMKRAAQPEPTEQILYFSVSIPRGTVIRDSDLIMKPTPVSMIPTGALKSKEQLIGRELIVDVVKDEFALMNKTMVRGEVREAIESLWEIGVEVSEVSNFLGAQIKVDEKYALLFADPETLEKNIINLVQVTGLVDANGKLIHPNGDGLPKTLLLAVGSQEEVQEIASYKMKGSFELVRPPEGWEYISEHGLTEITGDGEAYIPGQ